MYLRNYLLCPPFPTLKLGRNLGAVVVLKVSIYSIIIEDTLLIVGGLKVATGHGEQDIIKDLILMVPEPATLWLVRGRLQQLPG